MKISSAKAKGRRLALLVKEKFLEYAEDILRSDDIMITPASVNGPDLTLSPKAKEIYPFVIECKNVEKLNIWSALEQNEKNERFDEGIYSLVVFKKNNKDPHVCMKLETLMKLVR